LENALLDAAWDELVQHGYGGFTYEGVAARAGTSRPVVYRRWPTKPELLRATIAHRRNSMPVVDPDTGSLRGDVLALLRDVNSKRAGVVALIGVGLGAYFEETGTSFADLRQALAGGYPSVMGPVLERADARGEIDLRAITPRMMELPFDLIRHEMLITRRPVAAATLEEIVDTIFLPLVARAAPVSRSRARAPRR